MAKVRILVGYGNDTEFRVTEEGLLIFLADGGTARPKYWEEAVIVGEPDNHRVVTKDPKIIVSIPDELLAFMSKDLHPSLRLEIKLARKRLEAKFDLNELQRHWRQKNEKALGITEQREFDQRALALRAKAHSGWIVEFPTIFRFGFFDAPQFMELEKVLGELMSDGTVTWKSNGKQFAIYNGQQSSGVTVETVNPGKVALVLSNIAPCEHVVIPNPGSLMGKTLDACAIFTPASKFGRKDVVLWATTDNPGQELIAQLGGSQALQDLVSKQGYSKLPEWTAMVRNVNTGRIYYMKIIFSWREGKLLLYRDDRTQDEGLHTNGEDM